MTEQINKKMEEGYKPKATKQGVNNEKEEKGDNPKPTNRKK